MGKPSRDKGKRGELEVAHLLAPLFPDARRGAAQSRKGDDAADVEGTPYWVEVKRVKRNEAPRAALRQATADADGRPPVVFSRCNGEEWMVTMRAEDWRDMANHRLRVSGHAVQVRAAELLIASTCTECPARASCDYAFDPINTDGFCLADK